MTAITAWRTDEPCPVCAAGLVMSAIKGMYP